VQGIEKDGSEEVREKAWLNYTVVPFTRQFFDNISSAQVVALKEWHFFFSQNFCEDLANYLPFII